MDSYIYIYITCSIYIYIHIMYYIILYIWYYIYIIFISIYIYIHIIYHIIYIYIHIIYVYIYILYTIYYIYHKPSNSGSSNPNQDLEHVEHDSVAPEDVFSFKDLLRPDPRRRERNHRSVSDLSVIWPIFWANYNDLTATSP